MTESSRADIDCEKRTGAIRDTAKLVEEGPAIGCPRRCRLHHPLPWRFRRLGTPGVIEGNED
jgi:hypothetical protein